jgi:hypothetical protein
MARLPKSAVKAIEAHVDDLFDRMKVRFLGPKAVPKKLYVGYRRDLSMPGVFESAVAEEGGLPDLEHLEQLLATAGNYLDAARLRAKARVVNSVQGFTSAADGPGADPKALQNKLSAELSDLFGEMRYEVQRILDTEAQKARNTGQLDGIIRTNASVGVEDPTVFFVVVRDTNLCPECKRLHLLENGRTPRVWKLSELGHGYHKRGESQPKVDGLHPHCRCSLTTLLPGFGFNGGGFVTWKSEGYDEYRRQRGEA